MRMHHPLLRPVAWLFALVWLVSPSMKAQAPTSVAGRAAEMTITGGNGPFASYGSSRLLMSATDNSYGLVATSGEVTSSYGTASYSKTGTNSAVATFSDSVVGSGLRAAFSFTSATAGSFVVTTSAAPGYSQTGTFRLYNGQAPASIKGTTFDVQVQAGLYPLASYGSFKFKTDPVGNTYQIYGGYGVTPGSGTYVYTPGEAGKSSIVFQDALGGAARSQTLSWDSSTSGAYVVRDSATAAYQAGTFKVEAVSLPPAITTQPVGLTLNAGATGVLSVVASSTGALGYQWRKGGLAIAGATGSSLVIGPAQSADAGSYSVAVTSGMGTVLSNTATLTVNPAGATGVAPDSISGRAAELTVVRATLPFATSGTARVLLSAGDNTYGLVALTGYFTSGYGTMTYRKTGLNSAQFEAFDTTDGSSVASSLYFTSNTTGFYTLTSPFFPGNYQTGTFRVYNGQAPASVKGTTFAVQVEAGIIPFAESGSFKLKTDPVGNTYQIYGGDGVPPSSGTYVYTPGEAGKSAIVLEDSLSGVSRSQTLSWDSSSAGAYVVRDSKSGGYQAGTFKVEAVSLPPVITTQPSGLTLTTGAKGVLSVVASSTDALSYQWRKGGIAISGATGSSLALNGVTELSAGIYDVLVTNPAGTVTSAQATLNVVVPATIVSQPTPLSTAIGRSASLSVTVTGTPPFTFTWKKDGVVLPAATSGTLYFTSVTQRDFGAYTVEVANSGGRATSNAAAFSLASEVAIASHPASVSTRLGAAATFTVVATGTEPLSYQWRKNGTLIPGATRSSYTVPMTTDFDAGAYEVFVFNDYSSATSTAAQLSVAGQKGVSILGMPGQPLTGTLTLVKGSTGNATAAIDPVDTQTARTTYQLLRLSGASSTQALTTSALVPSGGTLSVPLRSFGESGTYAIEYIRQYADGSPATKVLSEPFSVEVLSFDAAAGVYELLLEDSTQTIPDGATYRGALLVTVTKSGSVSGKLLYNEAPELYGAGDPARRVYTPVTRSFSGVFSTSQSATEKLVCSPKLGVGTQLGRQQLSLELDFTTSPVSLSASVTDRISVPAEIAEEGALSTAPPVARNLTKLAGTADLQTADLSTAVGRYNIGSSSEVESDASPGLDHRALILTQVLASGRVLWTSRIEGHSGSGTAGLRLNDAGALVASFYEGRLTSTTKQHHSNSLLAALQLGSLSDGLWTMQTSVGLANGFVERQSSHVTKNNGRAEYSEAFEDAALETKDFNWSCVAQLDLSAENFCVWNGSTKAGLFQHFSSTQSAASESTPRLLILALKDPAEGASLSWRVSLSSTGAIRVTPDIVGQPSLTVRFDKVRGEFSGSYVSSSDKARRNIFGAAIRDPSEDLLRAHGWVELNALPATKTASWKLELFQP